MTTHEDLQAIPDRVTHLERTVAEVADSVDTLHYDTETRLQNLELAVADLIKQNAAIWHRDASRQAYTITETATLFGCTRTQVYEMIAANRLHAFTVGTRARRIPADEVRRLLAQTPERRPI